MNIKFGMDNFYVKYLKRFLSNEMSQATMILGEFNKEDLSLLIKYLNLPNVKDMFTVQKEIIELFPNLKTYFNIQLKDNAIYWYSKTISKEASQFIIDNSNAIKEYCTSVGWELGNTNEWFDTTKDINNDGVVDEQDRAILYDIVYNGGNYERAIMDKADLNLDGNIDSKDLEVLESYLTNGKQNISIVQGTRKNYFPNKDMLIFINQFDGTFLYNYAIKDGIGIDNIPHINESGSYKIALYKCQPGQKVTISHNNTNNTRLVIGCSPATLKQDIPSFMLSNVVDINLGVGQGYEYTCSSKEDGSYNAQWLCIQCPSTYGNLSGEKTNTVLLDVGDINFDGKIDMQDYHLLARYTASGPGSEQYHWVPTPKQKAVMDTDGDGIITNKDTLRLLDFINGDPDIPSLGLVAYTYSSPTDYEVGDNVSNLLIIDGHYDKSVNIPFNDFLSDEWIIHEKFFNYLLGMAIHKYSDSENISYLQKLLKEFYPEYSYDKNFFYPGKYSEDMKNIMLKYQKSKTYYTIGDINRDGVLNGNDLVLLRSYLDTLVGDVNQDGVTNDLDLLAVRNYLDGVGDLTQEQLDIADLNKDGKVNETDYSLLQELVRTASSFSTTFLQRADINQDGYINELDYQILKQEIDGNSDTLKRYDISFMLGWCDVQTESLLELDENISGNISEVSK